jgi:hypothetical protein
VSPAAVRNILGASARLGATIDVFIPNSSDRADRVGALMYDEPYRIIIDNGSAYTSLDD